jgi:eukaryotic translation initiation factor 2C
MRGGDPARGRGGRGAGPAGGRGRGGGSSFAPREQAGFVSYSASFSSFHPYSCLTSIFAEEKPAVIDARLANSAEDRLILSFKSLSLRQDAMPPRPDYGTKGWFSTPFSGFMGLIYRPGKSIKLRTNFFPVRVPKGPLHEYDVSIFPQVTSNRRVKRRIFQLAEKTQDWISNGLKGCVAHDFSAKLIAAKLLPQPLTVTVPYFEEDDGSNIEPSKKEYTLTINYTQPIETDSLQQYAHSSASWQHPPTDSSA